MSRRQHLWLPPTVGDKAPAEFHRAEKDTYEKNIMVVLCSFLSDTDGFSESYQNPSVPGCFKSSISLFRFCQEAQLFFFMLYLKNAVEQKVHIFLKLNHSL